MTPCPSETDLARFLEETLGEREHAAIAGHVDECAACQGTIAKLLEDDAKRLLARHSEASTQEPPEQPTELKYLEQVATNPPNGNEAVHTNEPSAPTPAPEGYEILEQIGRGGMGTVFKARQVRMGRIVALKLLSPEYLADAERLQRFKKEIRTLERLRHEHIVQMHDGGVIEAPYLAMEYLEGEDLEHFVEREGSLSVADACSFVCQAAAGLAYAHQLKDPIVHRDVKPSNLFLVKTTEGNIIKVLDLGLAKFKPDPELGAQGRATATGVILGTAKYMAPEQASGKREVDHRADIYSLGCTLFYLLTGEAPFRGDKLFDMLDGHVNRPIPQVNDIRSDVPPDVAAVLNRMLAKNPDDRYQSMADVMQALEMWSTPTVENARRAQENLSVHRPQVRSWRLIGLMAIVLLAAVSVWGFWVLHSTKTTNPDPGPPAGAIQPLDLLRAVDPKRDAITGMWERDGKAILVYPVGFCRLMLSVAPEGDYELTVKLIRKQGQDGEVNLLLPVAHQKACSVFLGRSDRFGLENNAEVLKEVIRADIFRNNESHSVRCRVRHAGDDVSIEVALDGMELFSWQGPAATLSPRQEWLIPNNALGLGSHQNVVRFEEVSLVMLSGSAKQIPGWSAVGWHAADEGWHELLPLVAIPRHTVLGRWQRDKDGIRGEAFDFARLLVPVIPVGSYEVKMEWERLSGDQEMVLILPAGESPFTLSWFMLSLPNRDWLGISEMDDEDKRTATRPRKPEEFQVGKVATALVRVRPVGDKAEITLTINEQPGIQWTGPLSRLHLREDWKVHPKAMALGVHGDSVLFRHLSIRRLSGKLLKLVEEDRMNADSR